MSISDIVQGTCKIWNRLFDHRGFLNGEINFVQKEFEQKRGDGEIDSLFAVIETVTELKDTQIDRLKNVVRETVPDLLLDLDQALDTYHTILGLENDTEKEKTLEENRQVRKLEWDKFLREIETGYSEVDSSFEDKEKELKEHYDKLEKELKKVSH